MVGNGSWGRGEPREVAETHGQERKGLPLPAASYEFSWLNKTAPSCFAGPSPWSNFFPYSYNLVFLSGNKWHRLHPEITLQAPIAKHGEVTTFQTKSWPELAGWGKQYVFSPNVALRNC